MRTNPVSRSVFFPCRFLFVLSGMVVVLLVTACAERPKTPATQESQTAPTRVSTSTPALSEVLPLTTSTSTVMVAAGGQEIQPPPAGIVFLTDEGQFITRSGRPPEMLYQPQESGSWSNLSPDQRFALEFNIYDQVLVDLQQSNRTQIWPMEGLNLCPFNWVAGQDAFLLTVLLPAGADPGYSCNLGSPVLLSATRQELTILDEHGTGLSAPAVSPDGEGFAYNLDGVPWIYRFDSGPAQLDLGSFGVGSLQTAQLADPAWSPSGRYLAWTIRDQGDSGMQGVILLDMIQPAALVLSPYEVGDYEASRPRIYFAPSENYLVLDYYQASQGDFASQLLSVDGGLSRQLDGYFSRWAPINDWLSVEKKPGQDTCRLAIESVDGSLVMPICYGDQIVWSPDGMQVISFPYNRELFWLTDLGTQSTVQIDLPAGAEILSWEVGE